MLRGILLVAIMACSVCVGCASDSGPASEEPAASAESTPAPPSSSPLSKLRVGMLEGEVTERLGPASARNSYQTGKSKIPFYFGSDTRRKIWKYRGQGRVIFSSGRWRPYRVMRIEYDPAETGEWAGYDGEGLGYPPSIGTPRPPGAPRLPTPGVPRAPRIPRPF